MKPELPAKALDQHIVALGKTGAGKSSVLRLIVEGLLDAGQPTCVFDPKGDWWGLKSSADGKRAGFPVVIFGGEHADVPLNPRAGAAVAELVASGNRPCIIDLGGWMVGDRTRFFIDFASHLFRHTRGRRYLVIDECHNFAPQGKVLDPDAGKMLHWANRLASEGRGKGLVLLSASQRPQKVHKDYLTCHETLIALRVIHPLDRGAVKDWMDGCPDADKGREVLATLAGMPRGTGWVWSPEIGFGPKQIAFPKFKTYDSFAPPAGDVVERLKGWAEVDLEEVRTRLADAVKEAEANDPKRLRAEIAKLQRELTARPTEKTLAIDHDAVREAEERGRNDGYAAGLRAVLSTGPLLPRLMETISGLRDLHNALEAHAPGALAAPARHEPRRIVLTKPPAREVFVAPAPRQAHGNGAGEVGNTGLRRMLIALAQRPQGMNRRQLGLRAGLSSGSGTFATYLGKGRSSGWINGDGSTIRITAEGVAALGAYEPLPRGEALLAYWLGELGNTGAARLLRALAEAYPNGLDRSAAARAADLSAGSGTFATYLGRLRSLELVEGSAELRASAELFD